MSDPKEQFTQIPGKDKKLAIVSDLHMGDTRANQTASLLNHFKHYPRTSPKWDPNNDNRLQNFANQLKQACNEVAPIGKPFDFLILLGDIFETSLATFQESIANVREFLVHIGGKNYVKNFLYIPGNHDHHLWTMINEENEISQNIRNNADNRSSKEILPLPFHQQTDLEYDASFLDVLGEPNFYVASPNAICRYGEDILYIFHHGHLLSDNFTFLSQTLSESKISNIKTLEDLETVNSGWTEFGWYYMGQTRKVGEMIERVYNGLKGNEKEKEDALEVVDKLIDYLYKKHIDDNLLKFFKFIVKRRIKKLILRKVSKRELGVSEARNMPITGKIEQIKEYLKLLKESEKEKELSNYGIKEDVKEIRFVFGHTHRYGEYSGEVRLDGTSFDLKVFNCGCWKEDRPIDNRILTVDESGKMVAYPKYDAHVRLFKDDGFQNDDGTDPLEVDIREGWCINLAEKYQDKVSSFILEAPSKVCLHLYEDTDLKGSKAKWKGQDGTPVKVDKSDLKKKKLHDKVSSLEWSVSS